MIRAVLVLSFAVGCAGTDAGPAPCPVSVEDETHPFRTSCVSGTCHDPQKPAGALDLLSPNPEDRMIGIASAHPFCKHRLLIDPANPASSFLLEKISRSDPECGGRMPFGPAPLTEASVACLQKWITTVLDE